MCTVFHGPVYLYVGLACGHGYIVCIKYIHGLPCIADLFVGKKRYRHHHEQGGDQACPRNKGGKPDLGFDIFYYHELKCVKGLKLGDQLSCRTGCIGSTATHRGGCRGDAGCRYDPCTDTWYGEHGQSSDQECHDDDAET